MPTPAPWLTAFSAYLVLACGSHPSTPTPSSEVATRSGPGCDSLAQAIQAGTAHPVTHGPFPKRISLPPTPPPPDLRGRDLVVSWYVMASGEAVLDTASIPSSSDTDYRAQFIEVLAGYRFAPAIANGCAVLAVYTTRVVLK